MGFICLQMYLHTSLKYGAASNDSMLKKTSGNKATNIDNVHFFFVVHVVDCQTSLVDEEVQSSIQLH